MNNTVDTIIIAVLSEERANRLREILEAHAIPSSLEDVEAPTEQGTYKALRIRRSDLPLAIKIVESGEPLSAAAVELKLAGMSGNVLIPVDFSEYSLLAVRVGFEFAKRLSLHPLLLHTFASPSLMDVLPSLDDVTATMPDVEEVEVDASIEQSAQTEMSRFALKLRDMRKKGEIPNVKFSVKTCQGVPEDVIKEYCRVSPPALIVMATRGRDKKASEMVGSVTAEVIDSCRVPIVTVPEGYDFPGVENIMKLGFFCNLEPHDLLSMESFLQMFSYPEVDITLFPVSEKNESRAGKRLDILFDYFSHQYPAVNFSKASLGSSHYRTQLEAYLKEHHLDLLLIPNKKTSIFKRLFNPSIAHRILFERDIPMLVLPV